MTPPRRRGRAAIYVLVAFSVVITAHLSGLRLGLLFDAEGSRSAGALLQGFAHPDLGGEFLWRIAGLSLESLLIGVLATTLAVLLGVVLAALCTRIPPLEDPPGRGRYQHALGVTARLAVRGLLALFRSVPDLVWAFLFVRMIGLGPAPAVFAIAITTGGIFGKLFAELAETVEPESIRALRRIGVGRLGILLHGVLPQVRRQWVGYAFYRLECSVRSASILGIVGAGGLGTEIALDLRYLEYDKLATALLAVMVLVIANELASAWLRRRPFKYTLWLVALGSGAAFVRLDIPWSQLTATSILPGWLIDGGAPARPGLVLEAANLAAQTVAMAWCATWSAAAVAMVLAPCVVIAVTRCAVAGSPGARRGSRSRSFACCCSPSGRSPSSRWR